MYVNKVDILTNVTSDEENTALSLLNTKGKKERRGANRNV